MATLGKMSEIEKRTKLAQILQPNTTTADILKIHSCIT